MDRDGDGYRLSTGRTFYANNGVLGLASDDGPEMLSEGYDGTVDMAGWTIQERQEVAVYMAAVWLAWGKVGEQR